MILGLVKNKEKHWDRLLGRYEENLEKEKEDFRETIESLSMIVDGF